MQHSISPFIAALRFFKITQRDKIDTLYNFIKTELLQNWDQITLARVRFSGILEMLKGILHIDPERPERMNPMEFIGSLVTKEDGSSPLIEWLRNKSEQDMEAMGKILQGNLLEAYGKKFSHNLKIL